MVKFGLALIGSVLALASPAWAQQSLIEQARSSYDAQQFLDAFEKANRALSRQPSSSTALYLVGISACKLPQFRSRGRDALKIYLHGFKLTNAQRVSATDALRKCVDPPATRPGKSSGGIGFGLPNLSSISNSIHSLKSQGAAKRPADEK